MSGSIEIYRWAALQFDGWWRAARCGGHRHPVGFVALLGLIGLAGILMRNTLILKQQVADNFAAGVPALDGIYGVCRAGHAV